MAARSAQRRKTAARKARQAAACRRFQEAEEGMIRSVFGEAAIKALGSTPFAFLSLRQKQFIVTNYGEPHAR